MTVDTPFPHLTRLSRRWAALVLYAVAHGDAQPVDVSVRLLPACDCPKDCPHTADYRDYLERRAAYEEQGVPVTPVEVPAPAPCDCPDVPALTCPHMPAARDFLGGLEVRKYAATMTLADVPPGGLSQRTLNSLSLEEGRKRVRSQLMGVSVDQTSPAVRERIREAYADRLSEPVKRQGRPARDPLEALRQCAAVEDGYARGLTLDQIADGVGTSRSKLKGALDWARQQDPPLFTTPGRGRRGGALTPEGRALLTELGGADQEE
jgi:hypothetical protein